MSGVIKDYIFLFYFNYFIKINILAVSEMTAGTESLLIQLFVLEFSHVIYVVFSSF